MMPTDFLQKKYDEALEKAANQETPISDLSDDIKKVLDIVTSHAETSKAVLTVVFTSAVYKCLHNDQDIRRHQSSITNGYSGRTFDTHYITPFLKKYRFPSMGESGWLTRSLEQKVPYDQNYTGAIKPDSLKGAFIESIEYIQNSGKQEEIVDYLLQNLIIQRSKKQIELATPQNLTISSICALLHSHFYAKYHSHGTSRLPVIALYAIYETITKQIVRYRDKQLLPIESHTSADARSGRHGDIDIVNENGTPFEAVEVKFDIEITYDIVVTAKEKIQSSTLERYYILSTSPIAQDDKERIMAEIEQIRSTHGCQIIINGVLPTIKYYLRLLDNPKFFIENYAKLLAKDSAIKFEHKQMWNTLIAEHKA